MGDRMTLNGSRNGQVGEAVAVHIADAGHLMREAKPAVGPDHRAADLDHVVIGLRLRETQDGRRVLLPEDDVDRRRPPVRGHDGDVRSTVAIEIAEGRELLAQGNAVDLSQTLAELLEAFEAHAAKA